MNTRFLLLLLFVTLFTPSPASAQGIVVHKTDGSLVIFPSSDVEHISMVTEENTCVFGIWHLGYWKHGSDVIHFDGTEYMAFAGKELVWGGKGGDPTTYNLRFYSNGSYFVARNVANSTDILRWYIEEHTAYRLVLRDGDVYRYFYPTEKEADNARLELDPPPHTETSDINTILKYASGKTYSSQTPMGKHFENGHVTTDADREWLLNPNNEPDKVADLTTWAKKSVRLYPHGDPMPIDVNQHAIGDCCALAVFASFAYLYPSFIKQIITHNTNGSYTVAMYDPQGNPVDVCVSNKVLCDDNGNIGQVTGKKNLVTWATILEKAMMKWETLYKEDGVEGIGTEHVAPLFTGCGDSFAFSPNSLYTSELKLAIEWNLRQGNITVGGFNVPDLLCGTLPSVTGHAFTFMLSDSEDAIFDMRNPWGNGDHGEDGLLRIPDLRTTVQTIDARIVKPGAAAPYLREDLQPYTPPHYVRRPTDLGVSPRLLQHVNTNPIPAQLW